MKSRPLTCCFNLLLGLLAAACSPVNDPVQLIPQPVSVEMARGSHAIETKLLIHYPEGQKELAMLTEYLSSFFESSPVSASVLDLRHGKSQMRGVLLQLDERLENPEKYELDITRKRITITGGGLPGVFYGIQTIRQLLPPELEDPIMAKKVTRMEIPCMSITDYPSFPYRGMHLDVARHMFPVSFIKKYIDLLALHKMNHFHWHLTEDQGWRIEIKKYPRLTEVGAWRDETLVGHLSERPAVYDGVRYGGYYTQEEVREVVEYATSRFVTVIPEIEMPGHAQAVLAAYPELGCTGGPYEVAKRWGVFHEVFCAGNERVFEFLEDVLTEVVELFPSRLIHIGGDECPKTRWKDCPKCQQRIKTEGLADEYELQSYFIRRIETFLLAKNRNIIGWDEILEGGLAPNATVMSWRGEEGGIEAARMGHHAIMTPVSHSYFDYYQADPQTQPLAIGGLTSIEKVYGYDPLPDVLTEEEGKLILGAQGNVWTEYMKTPSRVEYMAYPRTIALAEVTWTPKSKRNYADFLLRLRRHLRRLDVLDVNYFRNIDFGSMEASENDSVATKKIKVVFMGNSITQSWSKLSPDFFERNRYINRGISGQTTPQMLARFREDVIRMKPDAVVILAGTNDIAGNTGFVSNGMIIDNIISMVELAVFNGIKVVLCAVLPAEDYSWNPGQNPAERIPELNRLIEAYALEKGYPYVDFFTPMADESNGLKQAYSEDGVHPNEWGYRIMEPLIQQAIRQTLQLD
jgi:hexosaminidase